MGLFSKFFGKGKNKEVESTGVFFAPNDNSMQTATLDAQHNFKYFWRELYWEYRRIIPAHNFAMIKIPFQQDLDGKNIVEHMWINNIQFDGNVISGALVNSPNQLTNVKVGDTVTKQTNEITDWMIGIAGKTLGGFTIHAMRREMNERERAQHDQAWQLDFGDPNKIMLVYQQQEHPENLIEHPMSKNMGPEVRKYLLENPGDIHSVDEHGMSLLHKEAIAGNKTIIDILLELGTDPLIQTPSGKTAADYAAIMGWEHLGL